MSFPPPGPPPPHGRPPFPPPPMQPPMFPPMPFPPMPPAAPPMPPPQPPSGPGTGPKWTEYQTSEGKRYWNNRETGVSVWDKPDELKTPAERLLDSCPWKEHTTKEGKPYYHNTKTNQTVWDKPQELAELQDLVAAQQGPSYATSSNAQGSPATGVSGSATPSQAEDQPSSTTKESKESKPPKPEKSLEERRDDFVKMLSELRVGSTWPWDKVVRACAKDPRFDALPKVGDKKKLWNAWKPKRAREEKEEKREEFRRAKQSLKDFFVSQVAVSSELSFEKASALFSSRPELRAINSSRERHDIYKDAVKQKQADEDNEIRSVRKAIQRKFESILRTMPGLSISTTWPEAKDFVLDSASYKGDEQLHQNWMKAELIVTFETIMKEFDAEREKTLQAERDTRRQTERRNRDAFLELLDELEQSGKIHAQSLWRNVYPDLSQDPRYLSMLGQEGSTPLDLFKLRVDDLRLRLKQHKRIVEEALKEKAFAVTADTTAEAFMGALKDVETIGDIPAINLKFVYEALVDAAAQEQEDRKKEEERRQRRNRRRFMRILRHQLDPSTDRSTPLDEIEPKLKDVPEDMSEEEKRSALSEFFAKDDPWKRDRDHSDAEDASEKNKEDRHRRSSRSRHSEKGVHEAAPDEEAADEERSRHSKHRSRSRSPSRKHRRRSRSPSEERRHKRRKEKKKHKKHRRRRSGSDHSASEDEP